MCINTSAPKPPSPPKPPPLPPAPLPPAKPPAPPKPPQSLKPVGSQPDVRVGGARRPDSTRRPRTTTSSLRSTLNIGNGGGGINA